MSRASTPRHAQTAGDLGFAVQFNAETPWHFAELRYSRVGVTIGRITSASVQCRTQHSTDETDP